MERPFYKQKITTQLQVHPACAILGPRQAGKTTIARMFVKEFYPEKAYFFDLEDPTDLARLENPMLALSAISEDLIVIDEVQRRPELFPVLRVLIDRPNNNQKFLILGSASRDLIQQSSETLAGRIGYIELPPFSLFEVQDATKLWLRGGFPPSYLAANDDHSYLWRQSYISTFLERDIPTLGFNVPAENIRRFWMMLAHYHGQIFNASEIANSLNISANTVRKYLDILAGAFMVRILPPWFENLGKRQIKSPKMYFRDNGLLNALLGLKEQDQLNRYPKLGAFWEGFALEELIRVFDAMPGEYYFWSTHAGAEIDLLLMKNGKRLGFEFKYTDAPQVTKSMRIALEDLSLDELLVIYPGKKSFPLDATITVYGLEEIDTNQAEMLLR